MLLIKTIIFHRVKFKLLSVDPRTVLQLAVLNSFSKLKPTGAEQSHDNCQQILIIVTVGGG